MDKKVNFYLIYIPRRAVDSYRKIERKGRKQNLNVESSQVRVTFVAEPLNLMLVERETQKKETVYGLGNIKQSN